MPSAFFGYPAMPANLGETLRSTIQTLRRQGIEAGSWEDLTVGGRLVVSQILAAIDDADCSVFDLTHPNANVVFELGYAIARGKPVRITMDQTVSTSRNEFNELGILKPIGYSSYYNSQDLFSTIIQERPWMDESTAYDDLLEPSLPDEPEPRTSLLYCPTLEPFEASSRLSGFIDDKRKRGTSVIVSDPKESSFEPITWLASAVMRSAGVLVHFSGPQRNRADIINCRHAFTAGLARGFDINVLCLAEDGFATPFDFETILRKYTYAREVLVETQKWISTLEFEGVDWRPVRRRPTNPLVRLKFGEHVAENELDSLSEYFIETAAFHDVVQARDTIFVGHRGTGKTANAFAALDQLRSNKTNLAVLIKPPAFEFPAMFEAVSSLPAGQRDYFFDALWRFVIQTEIGSEVLAHIRAKSPNVPSSLAEQRFLEFVKSAPFDLEADISTRLEQTLQHLKLSVSTTEEDPRRDLINEAFHAAALNGLRAALGGVLKSRARVAILVDNLDKGWDKNADFSVMARFILGLLVARGNVVRDFNRQDWWRDRVKMTVSVFLRSDIYHYLKSEAREADKLPLSTVKWRDPATLSRVLEARYETKSNGGRPEEVWSQVFPEGVMEESAREFILRHCQPRPRDVIVLANAAIASAIDHGSEIVRTEDLLRARDTYSQYAFDALLVENGVTVPEIRQAIYSLLGGSQVLSLRELNDGLTREGIEPARLRPLVEKMVAVCLLGLEVRHNEFTFPEVGSEAERAWALASRLVSDPEEQRFQIHPAYHSYLELLI